MQDSFENFLAKLRAKPRKQRRWISFGVSFVITLAILCLWYFNFHATRPAPVPDDSVAGADASSTSAFDEIANRWNAITGGNADNSAATSGVEQASGANNQASN